jgi:Tfp pilus assembly protein PilN
MNIEINLLPEELRPRPPVETRTLLLIVVIVALVAGCAFLVQAKISTNAEIADLETRIAAINEEIVSVSSNPEAVALTKSINDLTEMKQSYDNFVASRISWGSALQRVEAHATSVDKISALTQSGNTLTIECTASGYNAVTSYGRALNRDSKLTLGGIPSLTGTTYTLWVKVAPGGAG